MRFPCHWNIILRKWDKKWVLNLHVQQNYSCYKADPTALQSAFFSFLLDKALIMEVKMRKNRPPDQSSARSNLVEEAWLTAGLLQWPEEVRPKPISQIPAVQPNTGSKQFLPEHFSLFQQRLYPMDFFSVNLSKLVQRTVLDSTTTSGMWLHSPTVCGNTHC